MIKFIVDCDKKLKNKIEFVIGTCLDFFGQPLNKERDLIIMYSDKELIEEQYDVLVKCDSKVVEYFSSFKEYPIGQVKYYAFKEEQIPILFHDGSENLFAYEAASNKLTINADILGSSFYFLSLWQEYISNEKDVHERFCAKFSLQKKMDIIDKPIVTIYFNILKSLIEQYFGIRFKKRIPCLAMTHDVDYIKKWSPGIIYREIIQYFVLNFQHVSLRTRIARLKSFLKAFSAENDPYRYSLSEMIEFELKNNIRSTFFIKAGSTSKHDVSYSLKNKFLKKCVKKLQQNYFDIGLHPSYKAYNSEKIMKRELSRLKSAFNLDKVGVREHFLRYDVKTTPIIHSNLNFKYDSSLSYNDYEGYRTGFSYPHKLYDIKNDSVLNITEVPLIVMDATLESYRKFSPEKSLMRIKEIININNKYGGIFTLLIHNTCYDELDYQGWGEVYEETIKYALNNKIPVDSISNILDSYYCNIVSD
jgi:hypothetical protein